MSARPVPLRRMLPADLTAADGLRALAGWNQTVQDWRRFLATEPEGCFVAEQDGAVVGTVTATIYGPELAWVGMLLVHPDHRRQGIGRALLGGALAYLRGRAVRCVKLDATPAGRQVYDTLGFQEEWTLARWERAAQAWPALGGQAGVRAFQRKDWVIVRELDEQAFGVARGRVLEALFSQSRSVVCEPTPGTLTAFGLMREGSRADYLGPVVAKDSESGLRIVRTVLSGESRRPVYWDIPDANRAMVALARENGFTQQRPLIRMFLGENRAPGDPGRQCALAGPEIG